MRKYFTELNTCKCRILNVECRILKLNALSQISESTRNSELETQNLKLRTLKHGTRNTERETRSPTPILLFSRVLRR